MSLSCSSSWPRAQNYGQSPKVIRDLLVVAKVAMPPRLYAQDPRLAAASSMLRSLEQGISAHRPPNSSDRPPDFDVTALALSRPVEESKYGISYVVDLSWDLVEASAQALAADANYPLDPAMRWTTSCATDSPLTGTVNCCPSAMTSPIDQHRSRLSRAPQSSTRGARGRRDRCGRSWRRRGSDARLRKATHPPTIIFALSELRRDPIATRLLPPFP